MSKKGFTLVELLAVLAIMGILLLLVTPNVLAMRKNLLENTLRSKINIITTAATEYGADNINDIPFTDATYTGTHDPDKCLKTYVQILIAKGYVKADSKDQKNITNPLTGDSMNNLEICIRFDSPDPMNRQIIAYIVNEDSLF